MIAEIVVLVGGFFVAWGFHRLKIPDVAGLVLYGVLMGPLLHVVLIRPTAVGLGTALSLGAAFILFLGGRRISLTLLKQVQRTVALLATLGVVIAIVVMAVASHVLLAISWPIGIGMAITIANTDPATIIPVMQRVAVKPLLRITVETEAAFNDVVSAMLLTILLIFTRHGTNMGALAITVGGVALAVIAGLSLGRISRYLEPRLAIRTRGLSAPVVVMTPVLAFALCQWLGGAGLLAAFIAGIASGTVDVGDSAESLEHVISTGIRVAIFVVTGALLPLAFMVHHWLVLLVLTAALIAVARPLAIVACVDTSPKSPWRRNDQIFMMWVRETGAISMVLAINLGRTYVRSAHLILATVAMTVVITVAVQATTTGWVAKKLNVI